MNTPEVKSGSSAPPKNYLKIKERRSPIVLTEGFGESGDLVLEASEKVPEWQGEQQTPEQLRKQIEPWLTALFQSEHLSLLIGAGLTNSIHRQATGKLPSGFDLQNYDAFDEEIQREAAASAERMERGSPNPEDQLRVAMKVAEGLRIILPSNGSASGAKKQDDAFRKLREKHLLLESGISSALSGLLAGVLAGERSIMTADSRKRDYALSQLVSFLMSFASRVGTRDRLHLFTTNYDRLLEFGAELAGLRLIDRFVGSLSPVFRSSRLDLDLHYNPPGIRGEPRYVEGVARYTKLHGSLDWSDRHGDVVRLALPFGAENHALYLGSDPRHSLIFPNDSKDRETALFPYVELFRDFAAALCRPNSTLVTYGYSFGDEHINRVIRDMLTIPSTHLVMISFDDTGATGETEGRLLRFFQRAGRPSQISILVGNHLGHLPNLVDYYLPKPAIDRASLKMADLLRSRGIFPESFPKSSDSDNPPQKQE